MTAMIYVNWTDARCARCGANVASIDHLRKHQRECNDPQGLPEEPGASVVRVPPAAPRRLSERIEH